MIKTYSVGNKLSEKSVYLSVCLSVCLGNGKRVKHILGGLFYLNLKSFLYFKNVLTNNNYYYIVFV